MADRDVAQLDSLENYTINGSYPSSIRIDDTHFILAYAWDNLDWFIKTFSIETKKILMDLIKYKISDEYLVNK